MKGIVPSLNTPFDRHGAVDHAALARLVDHTVDAGCGGMLGLAVAGEQATLTPAEKARYFDCVVGANAGRIPFIASVTAPDPADSVALARVAASAGADGICVQCPPGLDRGGMHRFMDDIARAAPPIVMVQDLDWAGDGMALDDILHLFHAVEPFTWLKIETARAGPKYTAARGATNGALRVCGGWAVLQLMDAMARGVDAFIPTALERVYVAIHRLHVAGRAAEARDLFNRLLPVLNFSNQHIDISIRFFKELRVAEGLFATGTCRVEGAVFDAVQAREAGIARDLALALMREVAGDAVP